VQTATSATVKTSAGVIYKLFKLELLKVGAPLDSVVAEELPTLPQNYAENRDELINTRIISFRVSTLADGDYMILACASDNAFKGFCTYKPGDKIRTITKNVTGTLFPVFYATTSPVIVHKSGDSNDPTEVVFDKKFSRARVLLDASYEGNISKQLGGCNP
jgi:hypothetical protein